MARYVVRDDEPTKVTAWKHNTLLVLRDNAPTTGALADVWDKIEATMKEGQHHVVLVLQDPPRGKEKGKRTEHFFTDRQGVCFAWLPQVPLPLATPVAGATTLLHGTARATRGRY